MYPSIMTVKRSKFLRKCLKIIYRWCYGCACICFEKVKKGDVKSKKVFLFGFWSAIPTSVCMILTAFVSGVHAIVHNDHAALRYVKK